MPTTNIFERASRLQVRFDSSKGQLNVEDLWLLPLNLDARRPSLDSIAINLDKEIKALGEVSFVSTSSVKSEVPMLKLEIVKHVIKVRLEEIDEATQKRVKQSKKEELERLIQEKKSERLGNKSLDELEAMVAELN